MNTAHFPAACTVRTPLPCGGLLRILAEAHTPNRRPLDLERVGIRLDRSSWQRIIADVATARELSDGATPDFAVKLTLYGPDDVDIHAPQLLDAVALAAIVADQALLSYWEDGEFLTLGRCLLDRDAPHLAALPGDGQCKGLAALKEMPALPPATLLLPPAASADERTLHQAILAHHPALREGRWSELFVSGKTSTSSTRVFFPTVDLSSPATENDRLLALNIRIATVDGQNEAKTEIRGGSSQQAEHIAALLTAFRERDNPRGQHWQTRITLPDESFAGTSFELALLLADRIARGREFAMPHGSRLIATGSLSHDAAVAETLRGCSFGSVLLPANTLARKCALFEREARPGDRVLVPANWQAEPALLGYRNALRQRGISLASVGSLFSTAPRTSSAS